MKKFSLLSVVLIAVLGLSACDTSAAIADLRSDIEAVQTQAAELQAEAETLVAENERLREDFTRISNLISQALSGATVNVSPQELDTDAVQTAQQLQEAIGTFLELEHGVQTLSEFRSEVQTDLSELEAALEELRAQNATLRSNLNEINQIVQTAINDLNQQLADEQSASEVSAVAPEEGSVQSD